MIAIVDGGGANLSSVVNAFDALGVKAELTSDPEIVRRSAKVVLPGVGAAGDAMARLRERNMDACIKELTQPVLGICLGMQLLFKSSEEGCTTCLGLIAGEVRRLQSHAQSGRPMNVPHMGWNQVVYESSSALFTGIESGSFFYFVHSYRVDEGSWVTARCEYGGNIPAAACQGNFFGVQFHPEKSSREGSRLLANFLAL